MSLRSIRIKVGNGKEGQKEEKKSQILDAKYLKEILNGTDKMIVVAHECDHDKNITFTNVKLQPCVTSSCTMKEKGIQQDLFEFFFNPMLCLWLQTRVRGHLLES